MADALVIGVAHRCSAAHGEELAEHSVCDFTRGSNGRFGGGSCGFRGGCSGSCAVTFGMPASEYLRRGVFVFSQINYAQSIHVHTEIR